MKSRADMTTEIGSIDIGVSAKHPEPKLKAALWQDALIPVGATLGDAIRILNETALQITLAVLPDHTLVGTITDGDVRRGLLRGLGLNSPIDSVIHREPLVVPLQFGRDAVLALMQTNKIRQLPVVDGAGRVIGLHVWDELVTPVDRPELMVIMAGGEGIRLRPHTERCPKPMLPIAGKPMLEHIVERARAEGFKHFVIAVRHLGHMIEENFGDGSRWQARIDYVRESVPLGTAGAIALLDPIPDTSFLVCNGDVLTDIRFGELLDFHRHHRATATMAVRQYEWQHPFGIVHTDGVEIVGVDEKPVARGHVNAGIYVLDPVVVASLARDESCDMPALFSRLRDSGLRTIAYPMHEPWLDVGRPEDYISAQDAGK